MEVVPLNPVPSQTLTVILDTQQVQLTVRTMADGNLYMDIQSNGQEVVGYVLCQNLNRIVRDTYLGLEGDFMFIDNFGLGTDPVYTLLGTRYSLLYLSPFDLAPGIG